MLLVLIPQPFLELVLAGAEALGQVADDVVLVHGDHFLIHLMAHLLEHILHLRFIQPAEHVFAHLVL